LYKTKVFFPTLPPPLSSVFSLIFFFNSFFQCNKKALNMIPVVIGICVLVMGEMSKENRSSEATVGLAATVALVVTGGTLAGGRPVMELNIIKRKKQMLQ